MRYITEWSIFGILYRIMLCMLIDTVNCFKSRLDTFWSNQDLVYNFKAEISGTEVEVKLYSKYYNNTLH